jgi:hypothetical protein
MESITVYKSGIPFNVKYVKVEKGGVFKKIEALEVTSVLDQDCTSILEAFGLWGEIENMVAEKLEKDEEN